MRFNDGSRKRSEVQILPGAPITQFSRVAASAIYPADFAHHLVQEGARGDCDQLCRIAKRLFDLSSGRANLGKRQGPATNLPGHGEEARTNKSAGWLRVAVSADKPLTVRKLPPWPGIFQCYLPCDGPSGSARCESGGP